MWARWWCECSGEGGHECREVGAYRVTRSCGKMLCWYCALLLTITHSLTLVCNGGHLLTIHGCIDDSILGNVNLFTD